MKRFKIGFLAVIALLAMSFTIADQADLFKAKKSDTACYSLNVKVASSANTYNNPDSDPCDPSGCLQAVATTPINPVEECETTGDFFCCAEFKIQAGCSNITLPEGTNSYVVDRVFCRE